MPSGSCRGEALTDTYGALAPGAWGQSAAARQACRSTCRPSSTVQPAVGDERSQGGGDAVELAAVVVDDHEPDEIAPEHDGPPATRDRKRRHARRELLDPVAVVGGGVIGVETAGDHPEQAARRAGREGPVEHRQPGALLHRVMTQCARLGDEPTGGLEGQAVFRLGKLRAGPLHVVAETPAILDGAG